MPAATLPPPVLVVPPPAPGATHLLLAGLESGVLGAGLMMLWFALDSLVDRQQWWAMLNLWGAAIYGDAVFRMSLGKASLAGAALHICLGGLAGAVMALALGRLHRFSLLILAALVGGCLWYAMLQFGILRWLHPLIPRMTPQPATVLAHLLYAAVLMRIPGRSAGLALAWASRRV